MSERRRRCFRPDLYGHALEERVVLSAASGIVATATAAVDSSTSTTTVVVLSDVFIHREQNRLASAFTTFIQQYERACQNAAKAVTNGQSSASALSGLMLTASIDSGRLQSQLQSVAQALPNGGQYLYGTAQSSTNQMSNYVPLSMRLNTQAQTLLAELNSATTLEQACGTAQVALIRTFFRGCKAALSLYIRGGVTQGVFVAPNVSQ